MNAAADKPVPAGTEPPPVRVLVVEDNPNDAELALGELDDDGLRHTSRVVDTETAYLAALDDFHPDVVLSDLSLPGFSGQRALALLRARDDDLPFIYVSATIGEEAAIEALRNGATDYILKQNPARLASAVRRALAEADAHRASKRAEAELMRSQRFEALAMLAGGLSHDLRNLLQPLLLAGDNLRNYQDDPRVARLGELVHDCGKRGLEMVRSMLSFARGARASEQTVRLGALTDALTLLLQGSLPRTIHMDVVVDAPELQFAGNQTELQQCLLNLCLNAIQAMPKGGTLRVEASRRQLDAGFFTARESARPGRYLCLSVTDTGNGMERDVLAHLFEPFFTTKVQGTGLGLVSCRRIVTAHGGVVRVDSVLGKGTRFELYLPLQPAVAADESMDDDDVLDGAGEEVLVVAEAASQLSLLTNTLDAWGYRPHASPCGTSALQWTRTHGLPDLVLLDADMHLFTSGRTLAGLIEQGYTGATVVLARTDVRPKLDDLPAMPRLRVLEKPLTTRKLLGTLRELLAEAKAPA